MSALFKRRKLYWILGIVVLLVVIRLILPYVILHFANKKLANLDGQYGHIEDIDLSIFRGAYKIDRIFIKKIDKDTKDSSDFFRCELIDLSVQWSAIWQGKLVGEVDFQKPVINYIMHETVGKGAEKDSTDMFELVQDFMPLEINRFAVIDGEIHYIDNTRSPKVDLLMSDVEIVGHGLTNRPEKGILLPADIQMSAKAYEGTFKGEVDLDPLNDNPTFDMNASLSEVNLVNMNPFFQAYANFDVKSGTLSMTTEMAAKEGNFKGYVKPLLKDMDVVQLDKEEGNVAQIAWEAFVGGVSELFENHPKDQVGAKIPLEGKFQSPDIGTIPAIVSILKNAFIKALEPEFDQNISIATVGVKEEKKGLLKSLFGKDKKKDKKDSEPNDRKVIK